MIVPFVASHLLIVIILQLFIIVVDNQQQLPPSLFGFINTGQSGARPMTIGDLTSQSLGLLQYVASVRNNRQLLTSDRLRNPIPSVALLDGVPVVPGLVGSIPGVGDCLPRNAPMFNRRSPSLFQDVLRNIPGAHDWLKSFLEVPDVDTASLMGRYYWVIITRAVHTRYCSITDFSKLVAKGNDSTFSMFDSFREGDENGPTRLGFGYGIKHGNKVNLYTQQDPCPYQVVMVGPKGATGQYEYIVLSNWVKYPVIGMVRNLHTYDSQYRDEVHGRLRREGYVTMLTNMFDGSIASADWNQCERQEMNAGKIVGNIINRLLFG